MTPPGRWSRTSERIAAALGCVLLGSCAVNERAEVGAYRDVLDRERADVQPTPVSVAGETRSELSVRDSMRLASRLNESLAIEGETYLQAIIERRRAAAVFLPVLSLSPSYTFRENTSSERNTGLDMPIESTMAFNPIGDRASLGAATAEIDRQRALLLNAQDQLLIDVARVHYEVIRAERATSVLDGSLAIQNERVADARARVEAGLVRPLDLSASESQAAETAATLIEARAAALRSRTSLAYLTNSAPIDCEVIDGMDTPADRTLDDALAEAEAWRQDLLAAAVGVRVATRRVQAAYGQYFPAVSINLRAFFRKDSDPTDLDWTSIINLSLPLFSAGLIEADVRDALSQLRQARLSESLLRRAVERDIRTAIDNLAAGARRIEQVQIQTAAARDALQQAEGLYEVGLATNLDRLDAQDRLLTAELDLVNAELDQRIFQLDLLRATGTLHRVIGLERDGEALSSN